jgi:uncharacterized RDD family membrane protein YckC
MDQYSNTAAESVQSTGDPWRDEVQARLERYKRRRGRRIEGAYTMRFPFPAEEPPPAQPVAVEADIAEEPEAVANAAVADLQVCEDELRNDQPMDSEPEVRSTDPVPEVVPESLSALASTEEPEVAPPPVIEAAPRPRPRRKVIAFPAPSYVSEPPRRLADPVESEQLRILDVPEELQAIQATPFLDGLLDAAPSPAAAPTDIAELPCAPLRVLVRFLAASADAAIVMVGIALFGAAAYRLLPSLTPTKSLIAGAAAVCAMLWALYEYLFLVYSGRTPGMRLAKVRITTFRGRPPNFRQRQLRVLGLYLSVLSLGMGVLWCFVDVDSLCWHDRISGTFPVSAKKAVKSE